MAYTRTVKFSYYTVCMMEDEQDVSPKRFDFEAWIKKAVDENIEKKEIEFDNVIARLEELEGDVNSGIWKIRFLKLRDTNIPSIVKKTEEAKPIELDDDEYIGEDLLMIYDSKKSIAMIQCNRFAMSKGKLEKYVNKAWGDPQHKIVFLHISKITNPAELKKKNFRYLCVRLANIHAVEENHRPFSRIVNSYYDIGGKTGTIVFSLGRGKQSKTGLNQEPTHGTVAISSVGTQKDKIAKELFLKGYKEMIRRLEPESIIFYGNVPEECKGNIIRVKAFQEKFSEAKCDGW